MEKINSNMNAYMAKNTGLSQTELQSALGKSKQVVTDNFEGNSAVKTVSGTSDTNVMRTTALLLPPVIVADGYVKKAMSGDVKTNLIGKIASLGDKISNTLHLDKIFTGQGKPKLAEFLQNNRLTKFFTKGFKAIPKSSLANQPSALEEQASKAASAVGRLIRDNEALAGYFKPETLQHFGITEKAEGLKTVFSPDMADDLARGIEKMIQNGTDDVVTGTAGTGIFGTLKGLLDKASPTRLSEFSNKIDAMNSKVGETNFGKMMAKGTVKTKNVITYGGGILGLFFAVNALVQSAKATKEAPKGEKLSTFMHVLSEQYVGMILFKPSMDLLYQAGGNKYRGMTLQGREALKDLITKTNANKALTKEGYKLARLQKDLLLKGFDADDVARLAGKGLEEAKNLAKTFTKPDSAKLKFWERPLKALGKILDTGLDTIKSPTAAGKVKSKLKGFAGGLGRFLLIMMVIQPLIQKPLTKLCHKIFGEPKTLLAKQKASEKDGTQQNKMPSSSQVYAAANGDTNLVNRYTSAPGAVQPQQNIPASSIAVSTSDSQPLKPMRQDEIPAAGLNAPSSSRYIPSIMVSHSQEDTSEIDAQAEAILKSTDSVIKNVRKYL